MSMTLPEGAQYSQYSQYCQHSAENAGKPKNAKNTKGAEPAEKLRGTEAFDEGIGAMPSWDELVAEHADSVYRLAFRLAGNPQDAEDLTQETFMRVFRSLQDYQPGTFAGWLHRITTNLFLDMVRHRSKIRMESLPEDYERFAGNGITPNKRITSPIWTQHCKKRWMS